eukprot:GILJ01015165.1.p1 GENE.GILJ01015165.1~~GILJ01015165.1.p1  ORF type:complete len:198 (+),score=53.92 GILJ01015165.1:625-1218(+)
MDLKEELPQVKETYNQQNNTLSEETKNNNNNNNYYATKKIALAAKSPSASLSESPYDASTDPKEECVVIEDEQEALVLDFPKTAVDTLQAFSDAEEEDYEEDRLKIVTVDNAVFGTAGGKHDVRITTLEPVHQTINDDSSPDEIEVKEPPPLPTNNSYYNVDKAEDATSSRADSEMSSDLDFDEAREEALDNEFDHF